MEFGSSLPHSQEYTTCPYPSQINAFFCPSQFWQAQLVSILVGLRTYQHPNTKLERLTASSNDILSSKIYEAFRLSYRERSFSIPWWQKFVSWVIIHLVTNVSTSLLTWDLWQVKLPFGAGSGWQSFGTIWQPCAGCYHSLQLLNICHVNVFYDHRSLVFWRRFFGLKDFRSAKLTGLLTILNLELMKLFKICF